MKYVILNGKSIIKPAYIEPVIKYIVENELNQFGMPIDNNTKTWFEIPIIKPPSVKPKLKRKRYLKANKEIRQNFDIIKRYRRCYICNKRFKVPNLSDKKYHYCSTCKG